MARGESKKGREDKKPKQTGVKSGAKSAYAQSLATTTPSALKIRNK